MTGFEVGLAVALVLAFAYVVFVAWARRQDRQVLYHGFWSPVFRVFTNHMEAITLWEWTLLLHGPTPLSATGWRHENCHVAQFRRWPHTFPFRYLWSLARDGYSHSVYEIEAVQAETV